MDAQSIQTDNKNIYNISSKAAIYAKQIHVFWIRITQLVSHTIKCKVRYLHNHYISIEILGYQIKVKMTTKYTTD